MTKNDFKNIVLGMQEPVLYEISHPYWDLQSCVICIGDAKNIRNKHEVQCLKLSRSEYLGWINISSRRVVIVHRSV